MARKSLSIAVGKEGAAGGEERRGVEGDLVLCLPHFVVVVVEEEDSAEGTP